MPDGETVTVQLREVEYVELLGSGDGGRDYRDDDTEKLNGRTIEDVARAHTKSTTTYAIRTFKRLEGMTVKDGQTVKITSNAFDESGTYYLDGIVLTREQVKADESLYYVIFNMDHHLHCNQVIKHRRSSQWLAYFPENGDAVLNI